MVINVNGVKRYILEKIKADRPGWACDRVSREAIESLEARVRLMIDGDIQRHGTRGRTFKP
ncbi:MAG: hypothetical protein IMZ62_17250 [Chloroflexi bacterium]|nr:hypothetical protein [Chloroflexota bacterium]